MAKLELKNNTISHNLVIVLDGNTYYVKKNDCITVEVPDGDIPMEISIDKPDKVSVKWLSVLLTDAMNTDARSTVYFDYRCVVKTSENCRLEIIDNNYRENDSLKLSSVRTTTPEKVQQEEYKHSDNRKNCKREHTLLQMIFLSGLPLVIAGLIYSCFHFEPGLLIAVIALFFLGTVPSVKSVKNFNKAINNANELLNTNIDDRCDYDQVEHVANAILKDKDAKGSKRIIAKIFKHLLNSI